MQYLPSFRASSHAACIISGVSSSAPGSLPIASTAPVAISLMKSAPPPMIALHPRPRLVRRPRLADAEFRADDGSGLGAGHRPATAGNGDIAAGHEHPRPFDLAGRDRVAQRDVGQARDRRRHREPS